MDRRAILAVAIYAALVLSLATPLYEPFGSGRDDSWALVVLLAVAHLGLGAAIGRAWVLALPVALSIVAFATGGGEDLAWLALLLGAPAHLVTYTYYDAHSGDDERREITLRELAEEQLKDLEAGGPNCSSELQRRLRR